MYKIIKIGLIVISVVSFVLLFFMPSGDIPASEAIKSGGITGMFSIAYLLLGIAVLATVVFGLKNMMSTPGGLKKAIFGIVGLAIVLAISYGIASGTDVSIEEMASKNIEVSQGTIKAVGAGINMLGILIVVAVGLIAFGSIKKSN